MKPRYILLDATPVLALYATGAWDAFIAHFDVTLPEIVVGECRFHSRDEQTQESIPIDLGPDIAAGRIRVASATSQDLQRLMACFDGTVELDDGEQEALALMQCHPFDFDEHRFVSGDMAGIQAACLLGFSDRCVSLEELLSECGLQKPLEYPLQKAFVDREKSKGTQRMIRGDGLSRT